MTKTFHISTLGCKLNKYESDCMANLLIKNGYKLITDFLPADIYIINTCAVTAESEKKSRQYIAKCLKLNPNAKIIICGCASENNLKQFEGKANVFSIIGNAGKSNILNVVETPIKKVYEQPCEYESIGEPFVTQTRGYLKVQDGCNNFCSYCLIPYLRGRSRSRNLKECVAEALKLSVTCKEIVITGIDLSSFKPSLAELLNALKDVPARLRLGSLEVNVVTEQLMQTLSSMPSFCPQFHLSLQSGDNQVLKRMNRHYTAEEYYDKVQLIRQYFPLANITTDVIVGFAEETEQEFENTKRFIQKVGFGGLHAFPYSKREGTLASKIYKNDLPKDVKNHRVKQLEALAKECFINYINALKSQTFTVLTEDEENGFVVGYTENYIKVYLDINTPKNQLVPVRLGELILDGVKGEIIKW